jgi:hypothetical protein
VRSLSPVAFKVLLYLAMRCYGAKANGNIVFSARSGCLIRDPITRKKIEHPIGLKHSATSGALTELQRRGLIVCTRESSFDQKKMARTYRLTWVRSEEGQPTNEFLRFTEEGANLEPSPLQRTINELTVRQGGQSLPRNGGKHPLQSATADYSESHSPPRRTRIYQGNGDGAVVPAAMQDIGASVSTAVLHSSLVSAARGPQGSQRVRATAPKVDLSSVLASRMQPRART